MKYQLALLVTTTLTLFACGGDEVVKKSFADFVDEVRSSVGKGAENCGVIEIEESELEANTCVANSFVNGEKFYAVYRLQGIDSSVGAAITGDSSGEVLLWRYDSNPSGGYPASSSEIESVECVNASLTGSLDSGFEEVFSCD